MTAGQGLVAGSGSWRRAVARRVRDKDIRRQVLYDRSRKAVVGTYLASRVRTSVPPLVREYLERLLGAVVAFWIIAALLSLVHAQRIYTLAAFGLFYALRSTYYAYRLARDPAYRIPRCKCRGAAQDGSEAVLRSRTGPISSVTRAALGAVLYAELAWLVYTGHPAAALVLAGAAVAVSAYLAYVMVGRIGALCINCINMAALNVVLLWQLRP